MFALCLISSTVNLIMTKTLKTKHMGEKRSNFPKLELYTLILKGAVEEIQFA